MAFSRTLEKFQKYPWSGLCFPNQIVSYFRNIKSGPDVVRFFVSFFDVKGLCWPLYEPHTSWNAIAGFIWTVNNDHDTTDTTKKLKFFEENGRKEVKWRMNVFVEDGSLFIA